MKKIIITYNNGIFTAVFKGELKPGQKAIAEGNILSVMSTIYNYCTDKQLMYKELGRANNRAEYNIIVDIV